MIDTDFSQFTHFKMMKAAVSMGVSMKVQSGVSFKQKYLFSDFISLLASLRKNTSNSAHAKAFKLTSNACYGKLSQSIIKYAREFDFFVDSGEIKEDRINSLIKERLKFKKKPFIFKDLTFLDNNFYMVETQKVEVFANNCPLIAFSILELAKCRNFTFFWQMRKSSPSLKLLYSDTDSFLFSCNGNWYKDMIAMKHQFDFSRGAKKFTTLMDITEVDIAECSGKIGKYKSEIDADNILIGYIGLQKKCYCLLQLIMYRCKVCYQITSRCTCSNYFKGAQLYFLSSTPTAKGKNLSSLDIKSYLYALTQPKRDFQTSFRFEQNKKSLTLSCKKYQS